MKGNQQSDRLTKQQKESKGVLGIFDAEAKVHDQKVYNNSEKIVQILEGKYPQLTFRYRHDLYKREINEVLHSIDKELGNTLFKENAKIIPDGGLVEVKDDNGNWRVVVVSEAKYQGKDIDNIKAGIKVGKHKDQDLMVAGNAIERAHKNVHEIANYMLKENYFPYILFLEGSNFMTHNIDITRPDGTIYTLNYSVLNRIDRLTASNYGMPINTNLCENKFITCNDRTIMLQAASIYTRGDGSHWTDEEMIDVMLDIAQTSLKMLGKDLFTQLTTN